MVIVKHFDVVTDKKKKKVTGWQQRLANSGYVKPWPASNVQFKFHYLRASCQVAPKNYLGRVAFTIP